MSEQANQVRKVKQLANDVHAIYDSLGRIEKTQTHHTVRFVGVESRLDALAVGQRQLREQFRESQTELRTKIDTVDAKVDQVGVQLGVVNTKLDRALGLAEPTE